LVDSLAGFAGGNQAAFIGGLHALFQEAAGRWVDLNSRLVGNKRIDALGLCHTFTVARISGSRKRIVPESVHGQRDEPANPRRPARVARPFTGKKPRLEESRGETPLSRGR
jgi:hypothetical protein